MKKIFLIIAVLLISACSTLNYQEPTDGPRARVRFAADTGGILRVYDDTNCTLNETEWMRLLNAPVANSSPRSLDLPLWSYHKNAAKEVYVRAGTQINGMFIGSMSMGSTNYSCGTPFTVVFLEKSDYEVRYQFLTPSQCVVTISEFVQNGDSWAKREISKFDNRLNEKNRGCINSFKKTRLY